MKSSLYANLIDGKIVPVTKLTDLVGFETPEDFEKHKRVAHTEHAETRVSTVFLSINHGFHGTDIWFETMVFGGHWNDFQWRYATLEEAKAGHEHACNLIWPKFGQSPNANTTPKVGPRS